MCIDVTLMTETGLSSCTCTPTHRCTLTCLRPRRVIFSNRQAACCALSNSSGRMAGGLLYGCVLSVSDADRTEQARLTPCHFPSVSWNLMFKIRLINNLSGLMFVLKKEKSWQSSWTNTKIHFCKRKK